MLGVNPQRTAVSRKLFHIEDLQPMNLEHFRHRYQGEVTEVLVINSIELVSLHQLAQMRKLHRDDAVSLEEDLHSLYESVEVRYVRKNIVADKKVGIQPLHSEIVGRLRSKEFY